MSESSGRPAGEAVDVVARLVDKATAEYSRQREFATEQLHEASKSFDQTLVTLSAGAVALSVSYLRPSTFIPVELVASWCAFAIALAGALVTFKLAHIPLRLEVDRWSEAIKRTEKGLSELQTGALAAAKGTFSVSALELHMERVAKRWRHAITVLQYGALLSFASGVVLLIVATLHGQQVR